MRMKLIFVVGPTASGKTDFALREAERRGAAILSCDSLCVYRGMDIGTAKPSREEQLLVPHYGLDIVDPDVPFSVSSYVTYRNQVLEALRQREQSVIVAGGSGFYLKSFFSPVVDEIRIEEPVIRRVEAVRNESGLDGLMAMLRECNPPTETFEGLDRHNPRRVEKALIRCLSSGKSYASLRSEFKTLPEPLQDYDKHVILISRPAEDLQERNRKRVKCMLENGLVEEVRRLRAAGFERNPSACCAIGYREVLDYLDGRLDEEQLGESIITHTNQLMRKQRTWFRHQIPVHQQVEGD